MFDELQEMLGLTYLFIAHDLLVVRHISDRIAVMYLGKIVELANANEVYGRPLHPYSKSLISAVPVPDPKTARANERIILKGDGSKSALMHRPAVRSVQDVSMRQISVHSRCPNSGEVEKGHFVVRHRVEQTN